MSTCVMHIFPDGRAGRKIRFTIQRKMARSYRENEIKSTNLLQKESTLQVLISSHDRIFLIA